jgi:hypothetical protein
MFKRLAGWREWKKLKRDNKKGSGAFVVSQMHRFTSG